MTQQEAVSALAEVAGKKAQTIRMPREYIHRAGGHPMGPQLYFGFYYDLPPITQVITKAQRILVFKPTTFNEGLKETHRWYLRHRPYPMPDYGFEDSLLARVQSTA